MQITRWVPLWNHNGVMENMRQAKFKKMRESAEELERLVASMPPMEDSTPLIRDDRERET
jgi:hypothetical protein